MSPSDSLGRLHGLFEKAPSRQLPTAGSVVTIVLLSLRLPLPQLGDLGLVGSGLLTT